MQSFKAFLLTDTSTFEAKVTDYTLPELNKNEVLVQVAYSDLNYKDALATQKNGGVIRQYPMIPGVDLAGTVLSSKAPEFSPGDAVLVTGYGLGVTHPGGFSQYQSVPKDWLIKLPSGLSLRDTMIFGTAGFTAALAIHALEQHNMSLEDSIVITGATGGVGSCALAMLAKLGYKNITVLSRKAETADWLKELGAQTVLSPEEFLPEKKKPLARQQFDFLIDTVGGKLLSQLLPMMRANGSAALCGNAGGIKLETTVLPFILRGINLLGIDSVNASHHVREKIWQRLATDLNVANQLRVSEVSLEEVPAVVQQLLEGTHHGRTIIRMEEQQ